MPEYRFQVVCDQVNFTLPNLELPERYDDHPAALKEIGGKVEARIWIEVFTRNLTIPCFTCGSKAKSCLHHFTLVASPNDGGLPVYVDMASAVCGNPTCADVAQRKFEAGMRENAKQRGTEPVKELIVCHFCNTKPPNLLRCSRCKSVYYCDAECQKRDWKNHKRACGGKK